MLDVFVVGAESKEKSGGLFTCGEDNADEDAVEPEDNPRELEETKEREQFFGARLLRVVSRGCLLLLMLLMMLMLLPCV